ncbi:MAG: hypothetical protein NZV14_00980 [Bryobacteraceae bacterium]|nr:hypothetical protein [Bryobacteraceae bacterium]MDW8376703.1 hypothetical protein [Bryobacterales bacterium]
MRLSDWQAGARRATTWLAAHLAECTARDDVSARDSTIPTVLPDLAGLVAYRRQLESAELPEEFEQILDHIQRHLSNPRLVQGCARHSQVLLCYGPLYAALCGCGREIPGFREILHKAMQSGALSRELVPHQQLRLVHCFEMAGLPAPWSYRDICTHMILCSDPNTLLLSEEDVRAITQSLFYLTDFSRRPGEFCRRFDRQQAIELLSQLLEVYLERQNPAMIGELLCALYCLQAPETGVTERAWLELLRIQHKDGGLVETRRPLDVEGRATIAAPRATILFVLASLMRGRARPLEVSGSSRALDYSETLKSAGEWLASRLRDADLASGLAVVAAFGMLLSVQIWSASWQSAVSAFFERQPLDSEALWKTDCETLVWSSVCAVACGFRQGRLAEFIHMVAKGFQQARVDTQSEGDPPFEKLCRLAMATSRAKDLRRQDDRPKSILRLLDHVVNDRLAEACLECRSQQNSRIRRDTLRWLALQQRADGSFGYSFAFWENPQDRLKDTLAAVSAFVWAGFGTDGTSWPRQPQAGPHDLESQRAPS